MSQNQNSKGKDLIFIPSKNYIDDLEKELNIPLNKVKLYYFKIMADGPFAIIAKVLFKLLEKNVGVELFIDAIYSKTNIDGGNFYYPILGEGREKNKVAVANNLKLFEMLKNAGAKIHYVNEPDIINKLIPFIKRDHRKVVIIERDFANVVYFGAANFGDEDKNDFMVKITNNYIASEIAKASTHEFIRSRTEDLVLSINDQLSFYLDIGNHFRSQILQKAYEMVMKANNEVIFVSQLPPELPLLMRFIAARINGATVKVILPALSHKDVGGFPFIFVFILNWIIAKLTKIQIYHCKDGYSHAKILICDESVLLGSHNLSPFGVACGTIEFSAFVKDEKFLKQVKLFVNALAGLELLEKILSQKDFA